MTPEVPVVSGLYARHADVESTIAQAAGHRKNAGGGAQIMTTMTTFFPEPFCRGIRGMLKSLRCDEISQTGDFIMAQQGMGRRRIQKADWEHMTDKLKFDFLYAWCHKLEATLEGRANVIYRLDAELRKVEKSRRGRRVRKQ